MNNLFKDICESTDFELDMNIGFLDLSYNESVDDTDYFYEETLRDGVFTEDETLSYKIQEKAKKAYDYIVAAIDMIIDKFSDFADVLIERLDSVIGTAKFKAMRANARRNANGKDNIIEIDDLPKIHKNSTKVTQEVRKLILEMLKKYEAGELNDSDLSKCESQINKVLSDHKKIINKTRTVRVTISDAFRIANEYIEHIRRGRMNDLIDIMESAKKMVKKSKREYKKISDVPPSDVIKFLKHATSDLKNFKARFATSVLSVTKQCIDYEPIYLSGYGYRMGGYVPVQSTRTERTRYNLS